MMARTQITLEPETHQQARQRAHELGISLAEYIRQLVVRDLGGSPRQSDPSRLFDLGSSEEPTHVAQEKDQMLAAAFGSVRPAAVSKPSARSRS